MLAASAAGADAAPAGIDAYVAKTMQTFGNPALSPAVIEGGEITGLKMATISPLADFSFDYQDLHFAPLH